MPNFNVAMNERNTSCGSARITMTTRPRHNTSPAMITINPRSGISVISLVAGA